MNSQSLAMPFIASRIFGVPLMIHEGKLDVILDAIYDKVVFGGPFLSPMDEDEEESYPSIEVTSDGIAIIPAHGTLVHRSSFMNALSGICSYDDIGRMFTEAFDNPSVKGILLDVDSHGGESAGCFSLVDKIVAMKKEKGIPVYCACTDFAFSAGYAIASIADKIYVHESGGVGSIGVIVAHADKSKQDEKKGIKWTILHAGERKKDFNSHEPLSPEAKAIMTERLDRTRMMFAERVSTSRGLSVEQVLATEAGLFFGNNAVEAGLADVVGSRDDAMADLNQMTKERSVGLAISFKGERKMDLNAVCTLLGVDSPDKIPEAVASLRADQAASVGLAKENVQLSNKIKEAEDKVVSLNGAAQKVEGLEAQVQSLSAEKEELSSSLEKAKESLDAVREQNKELSSKLKAAEEKEESDRIEKLLADAVQSGKLAPSEIEDHDDGTPSAMRRLAKSDPALFSEIVSNKPSLKALTLEVGQSGGEDAIQAKASEVYWGKVRVEARRMLDAGECENYTLAQGRARAKVESENPDLVEAMKKEAA